MQKLRIVLQRLEKLSTRRGEEICWKLNFNFSNSSLSCSHFHSDPRSNLYLSSTPIILVKSDFPIIAVINDDGSEEKDNVVHDRDRSMLYM